MLRMRRWTVLVFLAADNDLESFAMQDLHELEKNGSDDNIAYVVQIDRRGGGESGTALRGLIMRDPEWERYKVRIVSLLSNIGETSTGDPRVLSEFIQWGVREYPAERYGLVIWNHGNGWRESFIEEAVGKAAGKEVELAAKSADFGRRYKEKTRRLVFRGTLDTAVANFIHNRLLPNLPRPLVSEAAQAELVRTILTDLDRHAPNKVETRQLITDIFTKAIASDDTDMSSLDSLELASALKTARDNLRDADQADFTYSFVAFDACLMAGLETYFQIRELTGVLIGSEEEEPRSGWQYDLVQDAMRGAAADWTVERYSSSFVDAFLEAQATYLIRLVTQSAARTAPLEEVARTVNALGSALLPIIDSKARALQIAEKTCTRFRGDQDFLDIGHYADLLISNVDLPAVQQAARSVKAALEECVISSRFAFPRGQQSPTGLSVYYPALPRYDRAYETLSIRQVLPNWVRFIKQYHLLDS
jgi:hypothetical protein